MRRRKIPPPQTCRGCGAGFRAWREGGLCGDCLADLTPKLPESLRDFRARLPSIAETLDRHEGR